MLTLSLTTTQYKVSGMVTISKFSLLTNKVSDVLY